MPLTRRPHSELDYARCPFCGSIDTRWGRSSMERDRVSYRARNCAAPKCGRGYRVALLVVEDNPAALEVLSAYHDAAEAGASIETVGKE
jgi:hypothetical protein